MDPKRPFACVARHPISMALRGTPWIFFCSGRTKSAWTLEPVHGMDVAGKFFEQQRWILERTKGDNVAGALWRLDLLPRKILGKFAERPFADAGPASDPPSCPTYRPDLSRRKTPAVRRIPTGRVDLDRHVEPRLLVRVGDSEAVPEYAKLLFRPRIPHLVPEAAPDLVPEAAQISKDRCQ